MRRKRFSWIPGLLLLLQSQAQDSVSVSKVADSWQTVLRASRLEFSARSVYMSTINEAALRDDQAWAAGIGGGFTSGSFKGFQMAWGAYAIYNLWSTDLQALDPQTQAPNRYEIGLFDVTDLNRRQDLLRLEKLWIRYTRSKSTLTLGKFKVNSPFINPQDGRMNTTLVEGIWVTMGEFKKLEIQGGWIWGISPRSTTRWYSVPASFGIYPMGTTEAGTKSNYNNTIENSAGLALLNLVYQPNERFKINFWNLLVDNVMNSAYLELNNESRSRLKFYQGLMFIHQDAINNGGNQNLALAYLSRGAQSNAISAQLGLKHKRLNTNLNYTHITGDGRYLSPREWGRDPFYTFMMRERNDGFGNLHAFTNKTTFSFLKARFKVSAGYGVFLLPDVKDYRLNKYGMPSYHQANLDMSYEFDKFMKGMSLRVIAAYKTKEGNTYENLKFVYNKVNMLNLTGMIDFKF